MQISAREFPKNSVAITKLAKYFNCPDTQEAVFAAAFDWHYVPRSLWQKTYMARVLDAALTSSKKQSPDADYPLWFWRVHELLITHRDTIGSVSQPVEPK